MNFRIKSILIDNTFLFLTGAFIGWIYEVLLHFATHGELVNRGILHLPLLPIYGAGCVLIVKLKKIAGNRPVLYFAASVISCGIIEYFTSYFMEVIYHKRWWDYSNFAFNLNGRIFLGGLLGFGAGGFVFVYVLLPILKKQYKKISAKTQENMASLLMLVFTIDMLISLIAPNIGAGITMG